MRVLVVLFAIAVAACLASPQGRIVGGNTAATDQFPHQVSVRDFEHTHLCGGWIYSVKWVVSTASCTLERNISNTLAVVGTSRLSEIGHEYELSRIITHPQFNTANDHNLALLEILYEIDLYQHVRPIPMATEDLGARTTTAVVAGWGHPDDNGEFSDTLQWVSLQTLTNEQCRARHNTIYAEYITSSKICTDNVEGVGMCQGDGGNALVSGGRVIGTASWGFGGCGSGYPDVYTRMSYYVDWINGIVNSV